MGKKQTIAQETRKYFCYLKNEVKNGNEQVLLHLSGTMQKRARMYKELFRYENDAKIDYELGILAEDEYEFEMKAIRLLEQSIIAFEVI